MDKKESIALSKKIVEKLGKMNKFTITDADGNETTHETFEMTVFGEPYAVSNDDDNDAKKIVADHLAKMLQDGTIIISDTWESENL